MSHSAQVTEFLQVMSVSQTYVACTTSILVWDWLSCLPQEWKYIWKAPRWNSVNILYCMVRYYTLAVLVVTDIWFFASWSEASCSKYLRILPGIAVVIDLSVELVLAVRTYAIFGFDRRIGAFLAVLLTGFLGVMIAVPILAFDYAKLPEWPGPCIVTGKPSIAGPKFITAFYAAPMTLDIIMTAMTLYKAKQYAGSSSVMSRLVRDGVLYFLAITSLNLLNVIFFVQSNTLIQAINAPMSIQLSSVLCCRLILSLRAERDESQPVMKKFSHSRGRWVTDITTALDNNNLPITFSPAPPLVGEELHADDESSISFEDSHPSPKPDLCPV